MNENYIEKTFTNSVKKMGGLALKFVSPSMAGVPDRIVLLPGGRIFFAELKRPGEKARPRQRAVHRIFDQLGFKVYVIDSPESSAEVLKLFDEGVIL